MTELFEHITSKEIFGMLLGIKLFWVVRFIKEKDPHDDEDESFSLVAWFRKWFLKRGDNIYGHLFFSFCCLWIGVSNLKAWMGETLKVPDGVDEIGAAFIIGTLGTFGINTLKKAV